MKRLLATLLLAGAALAQQTTPPPPSAPREVKLPRPVEKTLQNGLRVIVVPDRDIPLISARVMIRTGAAADPDARAGLAQFTADLLPKGTKSRTAEQIALGVEVLGATLESEAWWDSSTVDVTVMPVNLAGALEFVSDVVRNASFPREEVELERAQAIDSLQVTLEQPGSVASLAAARVVFGAQPYGHSANGTPQSLPKITRDDLVAFHREHYRPGNAVLVLAGDIAPDAAFALAQRAFGAWSGGKAESVASTSKEQGMAGRVVVIDMPDAGQAAVVVAKRGIARRDPAYFRALVANSVLGGGYSSRLNQEIRIERGLSYGARSWFEPRVTAGPFFARVETKNESAPEVARLIADAMKRLGAAGVEASELTPRKAVLIGEFGRSLETTAGIVSEVSTLALHGLPLTEIDRYVGGVQSVTDGQVRSFAAASLRASDSSIVIAGNASAFLPELQKQHESVEVVPIAELDLGSPTLRVRKAKK